METLSLNEALNRRFELPEQEEPESAANKQGFEDFVGHSFVVGDVGFLLPTDVTAEVSEILSICRLPQAPRWLWGMSNLRGNLLPVFDLRDLLGFGESDSSKSRLLIVGIGDEMLGIVIDGLPIRVHLKTVERLTRVPPLPDALRRFSRACYRKDDRIWVDWDIEEFFSTVSNQF